MTRKDTEKDQRKGQPGLPLESLKKKTDKSSSENKLPLLKNTLHLKPSLKKEKEKKDKKP